MLSDEWLSRYGLLENFNASVTRTRTGTRTGTGTGTWTTGVTAIALCISCSRAKNCVAYDLSSCNIKTACVKALLSNICRVSFTRFFKLYYQGVIYYLLHL